MVAEPEGLEWFRYGASYVLCLIAAGEFYEALHCDEEAMDIKEDLTEHVAASDSAAIIAHNLLRLGVYWDEATLLHAAKTAAPEIPLRQLFEELVRKK